MMMKNNSKASFFKTAALIFMLSFSFQSAFSQNPDDFEEDVDDEPATFIDGFIAVGLVAGAVYGVKALGKKQ